MKSLATFLLIFSLVFSSFFLTPPPKKAEAFLGDSVSGTAQLAMLIADAIARALAQAILQSMIEETVSWANSGFRGNPTYATDPGSFLGNVADGVAGEFIAGTDLGFLCSPFELQVRLALQSAYVTPRTYQCTLSGVLENIEGFYDDFNQGGWDAWFSMTQNSSNNPYGAYLNAQLELNSRIAKSVGIQEKQLDWNAGFIGIGECAREDEDTGECFEPGRITTPGSIIKSQLDQVLPANLNRFINAQHLEDLIAAFVVGALNRFVFNDDEGLFDGGPSGLTPPTVGSTQIDIDGDNTADGIDTNNDGQLDTCFFGGTTSLSGPPCVGSITAGGGVGSGGGLPPGGFPPPSGGGIQVDIDGDGIVDGTDINGDGFLDVCFFGGVGGGSIPPCIGSIESGSSALPLPPPPPPPPPIG